MAQTAPPNTTNEIPGTWNKGLLLAPFEDVQLCLVSCCCPWWRAGLTVERGRLGMTFLQAVFVILGLSLVWNLASNLAMAERNNALGASTTWSVLFDFFSMFAFGVMLFLFIHWRGQIRSQYQIEGNVCFDCLAHFFCSCCSIAQEAHEVDNRELGFLSSCTCDVWPTQEKAPLVGGTERV
eukprot:CAMPEP_0175852438 /NCGR_PEP_ID=MMETSP0107_2-20121207/26203_1 /TAXON_ID=195067 ORGANISM="Goniomonas pacifica, Strain CCMP1869" /NCGR_SAMPLE_ID=MMETSP0107_2 /ASSEMBLY_ACC=CAM_ASM_000203 /LENGTH=180 /DNA_ID=CAMNT_0017167953 /DNA_START=9 /DNA_END=551 /DNA_ORIENTATION=-